jgi:hypothetical protein
MSDESTQPLSRRAFLRRALAAGAGLGALLAGCTPPRALVLPPTAIPAPTDPPTPISPTATPIPPTATAIPPTATSIPPTPTPVPPTRFAVIGDFGLAGEPEQAVADLVKGWQPEFVVTTGDNNYPGGTAETIDANIGQYYHDFIHPYVGGYGEGATTNRFFPVLGNHDWQTAGGQPYYDYFALPGHERYYTFSWGPAQFFMLDSMPGEPDGITADSLQAAWVQQELRVSSAPWKIVVFHHTAFSSGHHGSSTWMRWPFAEWGAQLVLAGHDHTYERVVTPEMVYFTNGLGGGARYAPGEETILGSEVFFNRDHGAQLFEITPDRLDTQFVTRAGVVVDSYTMQRRS